MASCREWNTGINSSILVSRNILSTCSCSATAASAARPRLSLTARWSRITRSMPIESMNSHRFKSSTSSMRSDMAGSHAARTGSTVGISSSPLTVTTSAFASGSSEALTAKLTAPIFFSATPIGRRARVARVSSPAFIRQPRETA
jgi:hypothetical protein